MKRKVNLSFSVHEMVDLTIKVDLPDGTTEEDVRAMIARGEIDWLEEINQQHTTLDIVAASTCEHRELLSVELPAEGPDDWLDKRCECEYGDPPIVPGVLFPWNSDLDIAGVERCDQCKRFASDEEAGKALEKRLRDQGAVNLCVRSVDKDGHLGVCATFAGDMHIPLTFDQGEQVYQYQMKRRKE